jgi:hypothetical protein
MPTQPHPLLTLFIKVTLLVTLAIVALVVVAFLLKIILAAAVLAALAVGGVFVYSLFRRRAQLPTVR